MERRNMPLSDPHHSTADLLSWSEFRLPDLSSSAKQPSDGVSGMLGGCKITNEEAESLNKNVSYRKNCSGHKLKEMTGSDLFSDNGKNEPKHKTINHYHQDQHSQISFSGEENVTPKKPTTLTEAAKQKEFSRTLQTQADSKSKKKQMPKSTIGHDISASPSPHGSQRRHFNKNMEESAPRNLRASTITKASNGQSSEEQVEVVKSSKKVQKQRIQELTTNGIFKSDKIPPGHTEKMHSSAKLQEMSGHNIFGDGKSEYRDYYGGERRPPGGESSISLV